MKVDDLLDIDRLNLPRASMISNTSITYRNLGKSTATIQIYTGDEDLNTAPPSTNVLHWSYFNTSMYTKDRKWAEVALLAEHYKHKQIDLRPYMIEEPYSVSTTDRLEKVLELFRHFHLRALPVVDPHDGTPVAMFTRADLFQYMWL
jgi:CBS domain-containing protein